MIFHLLQNIAISIHLLDFDILEANYLLPYTKLFSKISLRGIKIFECLTKILFTKIWPERVSKKIFRVSRMIEKKS